MAAGPFADRGRTGDRGVLPYHPRLDRPERGTVRISVFRQRPRPQLASSAAPAARIRRSVLRYRWAARRRAVRSAARVRRTVRLRLHTRRDSAPRVGASPGLAAARLSDGNLDRPGTTGMARIATQSQREHRNLHQQQRSLYWPSEAMRATTTDNHRAADIRSSRLLKKRADKLLVFVVVA